MMLITKARMIFVKMEKEIMEDENRIRELEKMRDNLKVEMQGKDIGTHHVDEKLERLRTFVSATSNVLKLVGLKIKELQKREDEIVPIQRNVSQFNDREV